MVFYLTITVLVVVFCIGFSLFNYWEYPANSSMVNRPLARKIARYSFLAPLWPIGLVVGFVYGTYKFFTKIVMYKEE